RASGGLALGCATRRRGRLAGRRPGPRLPLHDRPTRALSVGGEHDQRGEGSGARRVPRVLERDVPRAVYRAPSTDPRPVEELLVVGDGPLPRGNLKRRGSLTKRGKRRLFMRPSVL